MDKAMEMPGVLMNHEITKYARPDEYSNRSVSKDDSAGDNHNQVFLMSGFQEWLCPC